MTPSEYKKKQAIKLENYKNKPYRKISNSFIDNAIYKSNSNSLKTIYYIASLIENKEDFQKSLYSNNMVKIDINTKDMLKYTNLSLSSIRRYLKSMQETSITFINEDEEWEEGISLLPVYKFYYAKHKIHIEIFNKIANLIVDVKNNYTFLDTKNLMKFQNKHSLRLLPLLYKIANYDKNIGKRKKMDLDALNEFFGTRYKTLYEITRKILKPVKQELDNNSTLSFIYEVNFTQIKMGRPVYKDITIDLLEKKSYQPKLNI